MMASVPYPYIDIAVLDTVRERLAAGDAVLIVDSALDTVIFSNGPGARLAGFDNPVDLTGSDPELGISARRQISALDFSGLDGKSATIALRIASGVQSNMTMVAVSQLRLPDGKRGVMLSAPAEGGIRNAIDGLASDGSHAAILDADGKVVVSSAEFAELDINPQELARLSMDALGERDRMIKRRIKAGGRAYPAGIGRIAEQPAQFILLVIEDKAELAGGPVVEEPAPAFGKRTVPVSPSSGSMDRWYFHGDRFAGAASTGGDRRTARPVDPKDAATIPHAANEAVKSEPETTVAPVASEAGHRPDTSIPHRIAIDPESVPVRFTWKIDAAGFFSMISPEFGETVGKHAADVEGRTFAEVAQAFAMDPSGEIRDLLERHDTWSGRSVLWPIEGTDLRAPVDLAALPVYDRERRFEGFRGFGIVRLADAEIDPEAIGFALARGKEPETVQQPIENAEQVTPFEPEIVAENIADQSAPEAVDDFVHDPWQGEKPALEVSTGTFTLPAGDKVIRLEERRHPRKTETGNDHMLSPVERSAFREIAERLRREGLIAATPEGNDVADAAPSVDLHAPEVPAAEAVSAQENDDERAVSSERENAELPEALPASRDISDDDYPALTYDDAVAEDFETDEPALIDDTVEAELQGEEAVIPEPIEPANEPTAEDAEAEELAASNQVAAEFAYGDTVDEATDAEDIADLERLDQKPVENISAAERGRASILDLAAESDAQPELGHGQLGDEAAAVIDEAPILSRLPVPILLHNGADLLFANQAFFDLTGYASIDAFRDAGGLDRLFVNAQDRPAEASQLNSMLRTAYDETVPVRAHLHTVPWKGGHALLLSMRPIDAHSGETPSGIVEDGDLAALKQEVSELSSVLETATDGVVFVNQDGTIRTITQSGEALFGFDPAEVKGKPFTILFATESQRTVSDYLSNLSGTGVASLMNDGREVIGREAHGRFIPLFMTIGRLSGSTGYCAVMRDITQWKRAEEELNAARRAAEHASSQKSEFLARVSHEIRTPLNAIIGFSDLMTEERFGPVGNLRYLDYLKDINRSGRHVLDLVNDLLDISKIEAGQQEMDFEAVSLNESLAEAVSMMQPQANRNRVIIRSSFASDLPEVVADLRSVKQIALNLLSNAVRYTAAGGQVIVSTAYELTGGVVVRVRDTGIGMTAQEIEQAMKPFKQINALNRGRGEGTGLGLPLTKAMVEANRANFSITSAPGQGTLVEVTFPSTRVLAD
jgi:PAS domain S-box-containing protein